MKKYKTCGADSFDSCIHFMEEFNGGIIFIKYGFSTVTPLVAFTIKSRPVDLGESQVYQELLCFSTTPQRDWPSAEEV